MTSASLNSRNLVMSLPMQAVSISHRCRFEKCSRQKMHHRSHRKRQRSNGDRGRPTTVMSCVSLSLTSILAFTPLLFKASTNRLAATAAPPIRSLVFTISTRILLNVLFFKSCRQRNATLLPAKKSVAFGQTPRQPQRLAYLCLLFCKDSV